MSKTANVMIVSFSPTLALTHFHALYPAAAAMTTTTQVATAVVDRWQQRIEAVEEDIKTIMRDESLEKRLQQAEMEAKKASNLVVRYCRRR